MARVRTLLRAARRMSAADVRELAQAQCALLIAQTLVWRRPVGRLVSPTSSSPPVHWGEQEHLVAERLAHAINRAARYGVFRPQCLVRALALTRLLDARGIGGSTIRIGVRWKGDGAGNAAPSFTAHAWVVGGADEAIYGDSSSNTAPFAQVATVRALGTPRSREELR